MSYVRPEEVLSPMNHVGGVIEVIHDPGENQMSVARILWKDEGVTNEVIAARWNGNSERPLGNPNAHGHATWFVIDGYVAESVEQSARVAARNSPTGLVSQYREMAADEEREREAEEWSEGLIGDGSA